MSAPMDTASALTAGTSGTNPNPAKKPRLMFLDVEDETKVLPNPSSNTANLDPGKKESCLRTLLTFYNMICKETISAAKWEKIATAERLYFDITFANQISKVAFRVHNNNRQLTNTGKKSQARVLGQSSDFNMPALGDTFAFTYEL